MAEPKASPFSRPETVMRSHLTVEEIEMYDSQEQETRDRVQWVAPSAIAFLLRYWVIPAVMGGLTLIAVVTWAIGGWDNRLSRMLVGILLLALGVQAYVLAIRLWFRTYTRYIITPDRIIRMSGIVNRNQSSIQWVAITDISDSAGIWGQFFNFGDIDVETANEASKFKELTEVPRPKDFLARMNEARNAKARPPKSTPLNEAALKALVSLEKLFTEGGLVVEPANSGRGWKLTKEQPVDDDEDDWYRS
jgi:membrane protein YdbS with pleckstrin-like domain